MSDVSQGEGWWMASDHRWYPPEQHPDYRPPAPETIETIPGGAGAADGAVAATATLPLAGSEPEAEADQGPEPAAEAAADPAATPGSEPDPYRSEEPATVPVPVVEPAPTQAVPEIAPGPATPAEPPAAADPLAPSEPMWPADLDEPERRRRGGGAGVFVAVLGWIVVAAGIVTAVVTVDPLEDSADPTLTDHIIELTPALTLTGIGLVVVGVGMAAAALGRRGP